MNMIFKEKFFVIKGICIMKKMFLLLSLANISIYGNQINAEGDCTGKSTQIKPAILIEAQKAMKRFGKNLDDCREKSNCDAMRKFKVATINIARVRKEVQKYKKEVEQAKEDECRHCALSEIGEMEDHLSRLLQEKEAAEFISIIKEAVEDL